MTSSPSSEPPRPSPWTDRAGLFLVSAGILALEVLHVRVLSVQMWYHHAYIIVTMAMLGFAVAGTLVTLVPRLLRGDVRARMAWCCLLFGVTILGAHVLVPRASDSFSTMTEGGTFALAVTCAILLVPYLFGGLVVTLALSSGDDVHRRYFVNLVGSALGAWIFIAAITPLGGERLLVVCAAIVVLAGLCFSLATRARALRVVSLLALLGLGVLFADPAPLGIELGSGKQRLVQGEIVDQRWTPLSRLDVLEDPTRPESKQILQDGVAGTFMHAADAWQARSILDAHSAAYVPHLRRMRRGGDAPDALIVGLGGGSDLRAAVDYGVNSVLGIEINPEMVRITGTDYADYVGHIYELPGVTVTVGEGRSALRRLDRRFDLIQLAGVDTYTAGAAGSFVLSESYLYTMEALADYFDHLEPGGTLGIVRAYDEPPRETLRIFGMALLELRRRGVEQPSRHAAVLRDGWTSGTVFAPDGLSEGDIDVWAQAGPQHEGPIFGTGAALYLPGRAGNVPAYDALAAAVDSGEEEAFYAAYPLDVRPVVDDSPFFFNFHHVTDDVDVDDSAFARAFGLEFPVAPKILRTLLLQVVVLVTLLVALPLLVLRRGGLRDAHATRHLLLFLALGAGFMFVEVSSIQRLVLFLGHPTYSLTVVLFSFLFFAGLGSWISGRGATRRVPRLRLAVLGLCGLALLHAFLLDPLLAHLLHLPLAGRIAVAVALLAPLNVLMGMPFPLGLARLRQTSPQLVPWAIGANGGAGVIASVVAVIVAMESGFRTVLLAAVAIYAIGMLAVTTGPLAREE